MFELTGIYKIQSISHPDRIYIGSSVTVGRRLNHHKNRLINGKHHSIKLQNHVNKYGVNDLEFIPIAECPIDCLIDIEQHFISMIGPYFNIRPTAGSNLGHKHSEETRRKIAASHIGIRPGEETRKLLSEQRKGNQWAKGVKQTEEQRRKNSEAHKGKTWTEERKRKHSERMRGERNPFYGKKHTNLKSTK